MTARIIAFPTPSPIATDQMEVASFIKTLDIGFRTQHCQPARQLLGWSVEALSFRSGVSTHAIRKLEAGNHLNEVTMHALAYALETEGLVFFPSHPPMRGDNCRGATPNPRSRDDFHLRE